jgi:hypothetical protein
MSEKVISREYKVMLCKDLFAGDEQQLLKTANKFWDVFSQAINNIVSNVDGDLEEIADNRIIRFYDTEEHMLYKNDYIFRERQDTNTGEREVTLKFRHLDRYVAQDRNMESGNTEGETKFEEDIKIPFSVLYSFSTTQKIFRNNNFNKLQDIAKLYPDLSYKLIHYREEEKIKTVGLTIRELVIKGARFQIRNNPQLDSKCALIVWYDNNGDDQKPIAVEFSFKYGDENEGYTRKMAQRAYDVCQILQQKLTSWVDLKSDTKTAYIYKLDGFTNC